MSLSLAVGSAVREGLTGRPVEQEHFAAEDSEAAEQRRADMAG
jgi:hypothetical protein